MRRILGVLLAIVLLGGAVTVWRIWRSRPVAPGIVEASGRIEGDQAAVGAKVSGKIAGLSVREGDSVQAGQLIAELASEQVTAQLAQAEHGLHTAREQLGQAQARARSVERQLEGAKLAVTVAGSESRAQIARAEAAVGAARARLRQAEADMEKAAKDYGRARELFSKGFVAAQQLDQAKAASEIASGAVEEAQKVVTLAEEHLELARTSKVAIGLKEKEVETGIERLREARAAIQTAHAQIQAAEASRALAQANLADSKITAPFAGTVLKKLVEAGEVVAAGTPLVTLVDLSRLYAKVYVTETDLGRVKLRDPARVYTDAFPGRPFEAAIAEIAQQAEFTPRDVHTKAERTKLVFAVKLALRNSEGVLKPGMPADAQIRWDPGASWRDERK